MTRNYFRRANLFHPAQIEEAAVVGFASILLPALHPIRLRMLRAMRLECSGCESIVRCIGIDSRTKRMKRKIGPQSRNEFDDSSSKNRRSSGTFRNCKRSTKATGSRVFAKSWRRSLALSHRFQRAKSWPTKPMNASSLLKMQAPFIDANCGPSLWHFFSTRRADSCSSLVDFLIYAPATQISMRRYQHFPPKSEMR